MIPEGYFPASEAPPGIVVEGFADGTYLYAVFTGADWFKAEWKFDRTVGAFSAVGGPLHITAFKYIDPEFIKNTSVA